MKQLKDPSVAQSFIHSVANSEEVFNRRPQDNPSLQELVEYILKEEIYATTYPGSFSGSCMHVCKMKSIILLFFLGLLQVHFAAGTIRIGIQLHCQHISKEVEDYGYNSLLCPCCSPSGTQPLYLAFVRYKSTSYGMNHFIPLYPELKASKLFLLKLILSFSTIYP